MVTRWVKDLTGCSTVSTWEYDVPMGSTAPWGYHDWLYCDIPWPQWFQSYTWLAQPRSPADLFDFSPVSQHESISLAELASIQFEHDGVSFTVCGVSERLTLALMMSLQILAALSAASSDWIFGSAQVKRLVLRNHTILTPRLYKPLAGLTLPGPMQVKTIWPCITLIICKNACLFPCLTFDGGFPVHIDMASTQWGWAVNIDFPRCFPRRSTFSSAKYQRPLHSLN